jgi:hypothetical protein
MVGFDDPGLASERAEESEVGLLLEELLERADFASAEGRKAVSCSSRSPDCLTPPLLGKVGLNHHATGHVDDGFVGSFSYAVVLRSVGWCDIVLDARVLEVVRERSIAKLSATVRNKPPHGEAGLPFKEKLKVEYGGGGVGFLL